MKYFAYKIKNSNYKQINIRGNDAKKFTEYIFNDDKLILLPRKTMKINNEIFRQLQSEL